MSPRIFLLALLGSQWLLSAEPSLQGPVAFLRPDRASAQDRFAVSIAIDGEWMAVGAGAVPGYAAIYRRGRHGWVEDAILEAPPGTPASHFGLTVALSGQRVALADPLMDLHGLNTGGVWVFERVDGAWRVETLLTADETGRAGLAEFGRGVALSGDWLVAGVPRDDDHGSHTGSAYIFRRTAEGWVQWAKLTPPFPRGNAEFGHFVAIDGDILAVGESHPPLDGSRAVAVYRRGPDDVWALDAMLDMPLENPAGPSYAAMAIHGPRLLAGALRNREDWGSAFLYERGEAGWSLTRQFHMPGAWVETSSPSPDLGHNLALGGGVVAVGARFADGGAPNAGYAVVALEAAQWAVTPLVQPTPAALPDSSFGWGLAADGPWVAVGANELPKEGALRVGGVWLYHVGETPSLEARLVGSGRVELSWPAEARDWLLESRSSTPDAAWEPVTAEPSESGGRLAVAVEAGVPAVFCRLVLR